MTLTAAVSTHNDEGERNIQEFNRLTLNGLRNLEMMRCCWNS